jgi:4-amino-4-deoxy-L-arabinose transferase-like glycosyltransferase
MPTVVAWSCVAVATGLSLALSLYDLGTRSLWLDEGYTWSVASLNTSSLMRDAHDQGGHLVFYYLVVHAIMSWFGDSPFVMRLPSALAGAAAVPLVFLATCRLAADRLAGVFAAFLFAVSMPLVFWQQNARDYAVVVLLAVASTLLLVIAVQTLSHIALFGWAAVTAVASYTHTETVLLAVAQLVPMLVWPRGRSLWRPLALLVGAVAIGAGLPLLTAVNNAAQQTNFLLPPTGGVAREVATFLASGAGTPAVVTAVDYTLLGVTALLWAVALVTFVADTARRGPTDDNFGRALVLSCLFLPVLLAWVISEIDRPVFLDRYLIVSLPAAAISVAMVLARVQPRALGFYGLIYLIVFRFGVIVPTYDKAFDNFAGATHLVLANARTGDCIAFYQNSERVLYDYYAARFHGRGSHRPQAPAQVLPPVPAGDKPAMVDYYANLPPTYVATAENATNIALTVPYCARLWLFESHVGSPGGPPAQTARFDGLLTLRQRLLAYYSLPTNHLFADVEVQLFDRLPAPPGSS